MSLVSKALRTTAGLALGAVTTLVELPYVLLVSPLLAVPAWRGRALAGARRLTEYERARLYRYLLKNQVAQAGEFLDSLLQLRRTDGFSRRVLAILRYLDT